MRRPSQIRAVKPDAHALTSSGLFVLMCRMTKKILIREYTIDPRTGEEVPHDPASPRTLHREIPRWLKATLGLVVALLLAFVMTRSGWDAISSREASITVDLWGRHSTDRFRRSVTVTGAEAVLFGSLLWLTVPGLFCVLFLQCLPFPKPVPRVLRWTGIALIVPFGLHGLARSVIWIIATLT